MSRGRGEMPTEDAYGRVTNPERFRVLHLTALQSLARLEAEFEVRREEGYGLDDKLEQRLRLDRPSVRLTPVDPEAAPLTVAFSGFPGLHLRFGYWWTELLPACGCDACGDSGEDLAERLTRLVEALTAGRFRECHSPVSRWPGGRIWGGWGASGHGDCDADSRSQSSSRWRGRLGGHSASGSHQ